MHTGFAPLCVYGVHNDSLNNLVRGIVERVLYVKGSDGELRQAPQPLGGIFANRLSNLRARLLRRISVSTVVPRGKYHELYSGRKQRLYKEAEDDLVVRPVCKSDAEVKTFVKAEKINFTAKGDPAPRVIQPRSPRYNVSVGRYLKPFEKKLFEGFRRTFGYSVVLKGLNADGVAEKLRGHWDSFREPIAIGLDASRFDQHVSVEALEFEHSVYNSVFRDPELAKLLKWQLENVCTAGRARDGSVRYAVAGKRMSGDINTGMGNCLLMSLMVLSYLEYHHIPSRLANNGDDCVVILEKSDLHLMAGIDRWMLDFGFTLTRESPVDVFERIEFCQAQPVWVGDRWRMVRNIFTAVVKDTVSLLSWGTHKEYTNYRNAVGECGAHLTQGVPVWQAFYEALYSPGGNKHSHDRIRDSGFGYMANGVRVWVFASVSTRNSRMVFPWVLRIHPKRTCPNLTSTQACLLSRENLTFQLTMPLALQWMCRRV